MRLFLQALPPVWRVLPLAACLCMPAPSWAADAPPSGVLQLEASASADVVPDRTVATLVAVAQGSDVAALNEQVAARMKAALARARAVQGVEVGVGNIGTQPRWSESAGKVRQDGWTVRAQLRLRAADASAMAGLLGELGTTLQVQSVTAELSPALRQRELERLGAQAIAAFRARAQAAAREFGYSSYTLGEVRLGSLQGGQPQPRPLLMRAANMAPGAAAPMPVQPGSEELSVGVSGSVQLQR